MLALIAKPDVALFADNGQGIAGIALECVRIGKVRGHGHRLRIIRGAQ
jgi:hypothetical protein